jgi:hypothetical protein
MDSRQFGSRYGGGEPFRSQGEAAEYSRRRLLTEDEKDELRNQGKTEQQITDMQRSEFDREAAKVGFSRGSGWVPVYAPDGSVTYLERAYMPNAAPGATDIAVGGQKRVGERVDRGEVSENLDRPDLRRKGYTAVQRHGPYGVETVWAKTELGDEEIARMMRDNPDVKLQTRAELQAGGLEGEQLTQALRQQMDSAYEGRRTDRLLRSLRGRAGLTAEQAEGKSAQQLRDLIADTRAASERERIESNRRARMAPQFRNELAFREMGGPDSNEWQNAVAAQRLAPDLRGMTPTMREAMNMQRAFDLANAALRGGGENPLDAARMQAQMAGITGEPAVRLSQQRGEQMGEGLSAGHVQERYRHWFLDPGPSSMARREAEFRREMEKLNYKPAQIDAYLDARRAAGDVPPPMPEGFNNPGRMPDGVYTM